MTFIVLYSFINLSNVSPTKAAFENDNLDAIPDPDLEELVLFINDDRISYNIPPLNTDPLLTKAAFAKASDMAAKSYWNHEGPNNETPWQFITAQGYDYKYAAENLAKGYSDSIDIETEWIISPTHKSVLLDPNYKDIGLGFAKGVFDGKNTIVVVALFGMKKSDYMGGPPINTIKNNNISSPQITNPKSKSYFRKADMKIDAVVPVADSLNIFSNNSLVQEFIKPALNFTSRIPLTEGRNILYLKSKAAINGNTQFSNPSNKVYVTLDKVKPDLRNITLSTVISDDLLDLRVDSKEELSKILYLVDGIEGSFNKVSGNIFTTKFDMSESSSGSIRILYYDLAGNINSEDYEFPEQNTNSLFPLSLAATISGYVLLTSGILASLRFFIRHKR